METDINKSPTVAQQLARFVTKASKGNLASRHLELAKMVVASTLASAARGYRIGCVEAFRKLARESGGTPNATLWFNGTKVPAAAAAGVNNASSDAPGMDDTCLLLIGHFGGPSTAAALATIGVATLSADRVKLRNGKVVEGQVMSADGTSVRMLLPDGSATTFPIADVADVEFTARKTPPAAAPDPTRARVHYLSPRQSTRADDRG